MALTKKIFDIEVQSTSYAFVEQTIEIAQYEPNFSPTQAVEELFLKDPKFPLNSVLLNDIVNILARLFKTQLDDIVEVVDKMVLKTFETAEIAEIHINYTKIKPPKPKSEKFKENYTGNDPVCVNFMERQEKFREEAYILFEEELNDFKHCFSPILQGDIEFEVKRDSNEQPLNISELNFYNNYIKATIPEIHPSLEQIFSAPLFNLSNIKSFGQQRYSKEEVDINFSNEGFDDSDLIIKNLEFVSQNVVYNEEVVDVRDSLLSTVEESQLLTKKPVPENHGLIDISGCYISEDVAYQAIYQEFLNQLKEEEEISYLEAFFMLSKFLYFPPFKTVIDERFYGSESRFERFTPTPGNATAYLKAIGIGGQVRFELHSAVDLGAQDEVRLYLNEYGIIKQNSPLYEMIEKLEETVVAVTEFKEARLWEKIERYASFSAAQRDFVAFTYTNFFAEQILYELKTETITVNNLEMFLKENLKFSFFPLKAVEFGCIKQEDELNETGNSLALISLKNDNTTISSGNEFVPVIFSNFERAGIIDNEKVFLEFIEEYEDIPNYEEIFKNLLDFFSLQRAFSFYDFESEIQPDNIALMKIKQILEYQCENVQETQVAIFIRPHLYPNFAPFCSYSPLLRNCYDFESEKLLLLTYETLFKYLQASSCNLQQEYTEQYIKELCYRFVQENTAFSELICGIDVSVEEYICECKRIMQQELYSDIDEAIAQFIDVNVVQLAKYANYSDQGKISRLHDHLDCIIQAFKGHIDPPIERYLARQPSDDLINVVARELYEFVKLLAPLTKKPRVDAKKAIFDENSWPFCEFIGGVAINGGNGVLERMPRPLYARAGHSVRDRGNENASYALECAIACVQNSDDVSEEALRSQVVESKIALNDLRSVFESWDSAAETPVKE